MGIKIAHQGFQTHVVERGRKIDGSCGFAHTALLIDDGKYLAHIRTSCFSFAIIAVWKIKINSFT